MNIKEKILALGIAIIFVLFVNYGVETFHDKPEWDEYCGDIEYTIEVDSCPDEPPVVTERSRPIPTKECWCERDCTAGECVATTECHQTNPASIECQERYDGDQEAYERDFFLIALVIGIIAVVVGALFIPVESVASGIMGGGTITVIYGTLRYWGSLSDVIRFIFLGAALGIMIWIGYKKLNPTPKKK